MTAEELFKQLEQRRRQYSGFGACDTEGRAAIERVERAMDQGQPFPLRGANPWELYSSVPGWMQASEELTRLARAWYEAGIRERLGLTPEHPTTNYGILVAEQEDGNGYQIVNAVDSLDEARVFMNEYTAFGPEHNFVAPDRFVVVRRDANGFYTIREEVTA